MDIISAEDKATLLQKGISAARSGRSGEARKLLYQVISVDPNNEAAWLWLSGLMATDHQKRACLEQVLRINPGNVYARAGLARLQRPPQVPSDELEARLSSAASEPSPTMPDIEPEEQMPTPSSSVDANLLTVACPSCDCPISPVAQECPHCRLVFAPLGDSYFHRNDACSSSSTQPQKRRRRRFWGLLSTIFQF